MTTAGERTSRLNAGLFSSARDTWATPWPLFLRYDREFGPFDLDVCAEAWNAKVARYFTPAEDGLAQPWFGRCWMNPPYGTVISLWVEKAYREACVLGRALVVCLLPARTDAAWWQRWVIPHAAEIRFLPGRVKFEGARSGAPFPSAVVVFRPSRTGAHDGND